VKFVGETAVVSVWYEVYVWDGDELVNVEGGQEVEPRMRKPGGVKRIEVAVEVEFDSLN